MIVELALEVLKHEIAAREAKIKELETKLALMKATKMYNAHTSCTPVSNFVIGGPEVKTAPPVSQRDPVKMRKHG